MINPSSIESILNLNHKTVQLMHNNAITKSKRAVHQVYNRESRNIAKFIREQREFERKANEKPNDLNKKHQEKKTKFGVTLRYQENQLKEMDFKNSLSIQQPRREETKGKQYFQSTGFKKTKKSFMKTGSTNKRVQIREPVRLPIDTTLKKANSSNFSIKRGRTNISPALSPQQRVNIRRRVATQYQPHPSSEFTVSPRKRMESSMPNNPLIEMTRQKMERFIRNLHKIAWMSQHLRGKAQKEELSEEYKDHMRRFILDKDSAIQPNCINYMVTRRYSLLNYHLQDVYERRKKQLEQHSSSMQRQKLIPASQYSLLDSLSKHSILSILHKKPNVDQMGKTKTQSKHHRASQVEEESEEKIHFQFPFTQFISQRQTKNSLYRIASMNNATCYRIAFSLYDKNHDGKIDEDDLLQAISLSRVMPQLESDIAHMGSFMINQRKNAVRKGVRNRERHLTQNFIDQNLLSIISIDDGITYSPTKQDMSDFQVEEQGKNNSPNRFCIDKYHVFFKEKLKKKKETSQIASEQLVLPLTFSTFCRAFRNRRPAILYDVLSFLLGAHKQDFVESAQQQQPLTSPRTKKPVKNTLQEQTLEEKWNKRLKHTNNILKKLVTTSLKE